MQTSFLTNFHKRTLINLSQRRDHASDLLYWIKIKLHLDPTTTMGSCASNLNFAEIYVGHMHKYLKRTLGEYYTQNHLELQINDTLFHEALHSALYLVGFNDEKNVEYVLKELRGY
jgi:hypothetical protein